MSEENPKFKMVVTTYYGKSVSYKLSVEQFYTSEQLLKFRISAGGKSFEMAKHLLKKSDKWKIISTGLKIKDVKEQAEFIYRCQNAIDEYLKGPQTPYQNPKNNADNYPDKPE